jgi:hypothetical protein
VGQPPFAGCLPGWIAGLASVGRETLVQQLEADMSNITQPSPPKPGSKLALLAQHLKGAGASASDLVAVTGWQKHTIRAALTELRKRGIKVERSQSPKTKESVYRLAAPTRAKRRSK